MGRKRLKQGEKLKPLVFYVKEKDLDKIKEKITKLLENENK